MEQLTGAVNRDMGSSEQVEEWALDKSMDSSPMVINEKAWYLLWLEMMGTLTNSVVRVCEICLPFASIFSEEDLSHCRTDWMVLGNDQEKIVK